MQTLSEPTDNRITPIAPEQDSDDGQFHIRDDASANWLLRKLANIDAEKARVQAQAAAICKQLDGDRARLLHLYEGEILDYARRKLSQAGNRRRSVTFLQGTVAFRTVAPSVKVCDNLAAMVYAQVAAPDMVKTVRTLDTAGYRDQAIQHYRDTGEMLPGCESTPEHETHRLTFGG